MNWIYAAIVAGAFTLGWFVHGWKTDAGILRDQEVIRLAQEGAAKEIAKIEVRHITIRQKLEREIREKTVYAECRHTPDGLRLINQALEGSSDSKLPAPSPAN